MALLKLLSVALAATFLLACESTGPIEVPESKVSYSEDEYRIGVSDELGISVWRNEDLSLTVPVRPDGKISVPLVGDVLAAGKSSEALAADITAQLTEFIRSPQVTVIVLNAASTDFQQTVRVTGAVVSPAAFPFRKGMTVLDVVLQVGGLTEFASENKSKLYRSTAGEVKAYPIYLRDILERGKLETNYPLAPGDIISVPERSF